MNEPALGAAGKTWSPTFATPPQILTWLGKATNLFLRSALPRNGVKLYMNLHAGAFPDGQFYDITVPWWHELVSREDRHTVAVFDVHWYTAWGGKEGAVGTLEGDVRARCDQPLDVVRRILRSQVDEYAMELTSRVDGLKSCTEFSAGTNQDAVLACNDRDLTNTFIREQIEATASHGIDAFFWTWKMPYGPAFEGGWSLKVNARMQDSLPPYTCQVVRPPTAAAATNTVIGSPNALGQTAHPALRGARQETVLYS